LSNETKLAIIQEDPWLNPYVHEVYNRYQRYLTARKDIENAEGSLLNFARAHYYYGVNFDQERNGWYYREWAPAAHQLFLTGDFNDWSRSSHKMERNVHGDWEIFVGYVV
jgi:1,4-alpha-glucan branching enzyme